MIGEKLKSQNTIQHLQAVQLYACRILIIIKITIILKNYYNKPSIKASINKKTYYYYYKNKNNNRDISPTIVVIDVGPLLLSHSKHRLPVQPPGTIKIIIITIIIIIISIKNYLLNYEEDEIIYKHHYKIHE